MSAYLRKLLLRSTVQVTVLALVGSEVDLPLATAGERPVNLKVVEAWLNEKPRQAAGDEPDERIGQQMAEWIERGKRIPSVEDALIVIIKDNQSRHRRDAALAVGHVGGAKALPALETVFKSDDTTLQLNAITSMRAIRDPRSIDALALALKSTYRHSGPHDGALPSKKAIIRANIAVVLSESDDDKARALLKEMIAKETDPYVLEVVRQRRIGR